MTVGFSVPTVQPRIPNLHAHARMQPRLNYKGKINWADDTTETQVALMLAGLGYSHRFIQSKTKMSKGQLAYRFRKTGIKPTDYRNGTSRLAKQVLATAERMSRVAVRYQLAKQGLIGKPAN